MREVEHYTHLREQGKSHEDAMLHTMQRFGVSRAWLLRRITIAVNDAVKTILWANAAKREYAASIADEPTQEHDAASAREGSNDA